MLDDFRKQSCTTAIEALWRNSQRVKRSFRNEIASSYNLKNMPTALMLSRLPMRVIYELGATAYSFKMGSGTVFLKAKIDALRQLPASCESGGRSRAARP